MGCRLSVREKCELHYTNFLLFLFLTYFVYIVFFQFFVIAFSSFFLECLLKVGHLAVSSRQFLQFLLLYGIVCFFFFFNYSHSNREEEKKPQ